MFSQGDLGMDVGAAEGLFAEDAEEALGLVEPGRAGRRVVEVDSAVRCEPRRHFRRAVRRRVVEHDVKLLSGVALHHQPHEGEKVGRRVTLGHAMGHVSRGDLQRRIEVEHAVALVVVRMARRTARAQRQAQLRALECLDES
jgi:hypothetical protein